jgi:SAM-dependent methyltransferase
MTPFAGMTRIRFDGCDLSPDGAPRNVEASIDGVSGARYDGIAGWYESTLLGDATVPDAALRLLGPGPGRLLDIGCGTGFHSALFADAGWSVVGVDPSEDQLQLARARGLDVVRGHGEELPFGDGEFDAVVSTWTHTDVDDFAAVCREAARVLRRGGPFAYAGTHPCFVGPHSLFVAGEGVPELHTGWYRRAGRYEDAPGVSPQGLRAKVGATHLPLAELLQAFLDAGFTLERVEEPGARDFPIVIALRWRR